MRYQAAFLVTLLLPAAVLLQTLGDEDKAWLANILGDNAKGENTTEGMDIVGRADDAEITLSPDTLSWLGSILRNNATTNATSTTTSTTPNPDSKNRYDPDLTPDVDVSDYKPCKTEEGLDGLCVSIGQCDKEGVIDNTTLIDLRDGTCPHYLQRCCLRSDVNKTRPKPPVTNDKCGWGNPGASILRIKDENNINRKTYADFGEYPWMIAVLMKNVGELEWSQKQYLAGGSLIHASVVITTAHRINEYTANQIKCRAGEWDTKTTLELYAHQERDVKKIITHEDFYITPVYNDVSLLVLSQPFDLQDAPHIGVACLSAQLPSPGTKCYSMGWGKEFGEDKHAVILKKVELPYVPSDICQAQLRNTRLSSRFTLHSSHLCAGGVPGIDTCKGDGGSSLACPIEEGPETQRFAVYGMVAFGVGCGKPIPGVYVNIPQMHSWVDNTMVKEGFGTSSYTP